MKTIRFAVIGTNFISDRFADAVAHTEGAEISAVISRKRETADAFADKYGIPHRFADLSEALGSDTFDALYIATPNFTHKEIALRALRAGKHVLCEKIVADSLSDFLEMRSCAKERGLVLLEAMRPDFDPAYDVIRNALPRLGTLRRASLEYDQYSSRYDAFRHGEVLPAFDPSIGNNALADIGIYPLHMAVSLFGKPSATVSLGIPLANGFHGAGVILMTDAGKHMTVTVTYSKITDSVNPSVIEGEDGALTFRPVSSPTEIVFTPRRGEREILFSRTPYNNMEHEVRAFLAMIDGKLDPEPFLDVSAQTLEIYDTVRSET